MKCLVCSITWADQQGSACPQCGYDHAAPSAKELPALNAARAAFRDKTSAHAPETRVTRRDRWQPWLAALLGFAIFVLWLRACRTGGFF
ncbi:MAG TPA: hypothetical protein VK509_13395 [Polyangiales bacterium]|nr:hypothetical protein [Polyangiales bacterium]